MNNNLKRAEKKIRRFTDTELYCGYLTPSECMAIINDGGKSEAIPMYTKEDIQEKIDNGISNPIWFYFYPSKDQKRRYCT